MRSDKFQIILAFRSTNQFLSEAIIVIWYQRQIHALITRIILNVERHGIALISVHKTTISRCIKDLHKEQQKITSSTISTTPRKKMEAVVNMQGTILIYAGKICIAKTSSFEEIGIKIQVIAYFNVKKCYTFLNSCSIFLILCSKLHRYTS